MRKKQITLMICASLAMGVMLAGCGNSTSQTASTPTEQTAVSDNNEADSNSVTGMVKSTSDSSITVSAMPGKPGGDKMQAPPDKDGNSDGTKPEKPDGDDSKTPPERPDGDNNGNPPELPEGFDASKMPEKPSGDNKDFSPENMPGGEEKTYNIASDATLTDADGNAIKASDLKEGDFVNITLNDSGDIASLSISKGPGGKPADKSEAKEASN